MRHALLALLLIACAPIVAGLPVEARAQATPDATALAPGSSFKRHIARGEAQPFRVVVAGGEFVRIVVDQFGADVAVEVRDPAGARIDDVQEELRPSGVERVEIAARDAGAYLLTIRTGDGGAADGAYAIAVDSRRPATAGDRALQESRSLRMEATALEKGGRLVEARSTFERALALAEPVRGADDTYVAMLVFQLAGNALEMRDDGRARALYERAIAAFDTHWGAAHPYPAMARSRLALLLQRAGQRQQAEALLRPALAAVEHALGPEHPWTVRCLVTLANLRDESGDHQEAEDIDRRALAILDRTGQAGTILQAGLLNNLGDILRQKADYGGAEALFRRALAIGEQLQGPDSYFVSTELQNLGIVARERKDYATAIANYMRALEIRERAVGPAHPDVAQVLNNLAVVYHAMGDDEGSLAMHFRALHIWETAGGPYQRGTLTSVGNIARTYASMGRIGDALVFQRRADAILEMQLALNLASGSERQKLALVRSVAERTDRTLSLHLDLAPDDPGAAALAALVLLQRKGRVQDAMTDVFTAARQRVTDPADRELLASLKDTTMALARVALSPSEREHPGAAEPALGELQARKEALESALSAHNAEFRAQVQPVTVEAVQAAIPAGAALIEFAVYRPFDPGAERNADAYGAPRYAAYVLRDHGAPLGIGLGAVASLDPLIARCRDAFRDPARVDARACGRALDERVMRPLRRSLAGVTRLLISPDGDLNLVPFDALVDERGRFLIERYTASYLTSGRDVLRMQVPRGVPGPPVIVADPLFGEPVTEAASRPSRAATPGGAHRGATMAPGESALYFPPLSGSAAEARAIKAMFPDATLLTGRRATKASLEQVSAPRILHIASHGFFLEDVGSAASANPLLRSGLALAGANLAQGAKGDGILTALEAAGLDLWGTQLVTLSACDTGVGEVRNGEGVYGMRRAFVLAGAETLVMSLWPVGDALARDTMVAYYARLRAGDGRGDALRQAKLAILRQAGRRHPYFWAGFIQSGQWSSLGSPR